MAALLRILLIAIASLTVTSASILSISALGFGSGSYWIQADTRSAIGADYGPTSKLRIQQLRLVDEIRGFDWVE